jgi:3'-phosphoadenosine 5'-phosphosulfate sulfotransferase (PAPS reductase)/FAD synthetase
MLARKQSASHEDFVEALLKIEDIVPRTVIDAKIERARAEILSRTAGQRVAYAWSGGKDSQALRFVIEPLGIAECVLGITDLEYPAFLRWVTDVMPDGLTILNNGLGLDWLVKNPEMLFPATSVIAARWFRLVQHAAQNKYARGRFDLLLLGRRRADGNFTGRDGVYTSKGVTRYSPLRDWTHEDVLAVCHYYALPLPPCYGWPRGFRVGTGPWPARQWCASREQGWREVAVIDRAIVETASAYFPEARSALA